MSGVMNRFQARITAVLLLVVVVVGASCAPAPAPLTRDEQVAQIVAFVENSRGHEFLVEPTVTFVPDAVFQQHVLDSIVSAEPGLATDEVAFKALEWMKPTDSLYQKYRIAFGGAVVGFYDPVSKVLEVRGSELTPYRKEVVAHELTHALDDQLFGLNESFGEGVLNESQLSFLVAVEGDAVQTQRSFVASLPPLEQLQSTLEQLSFPIDPELLTVPIALLSLSQAPYLQGPQFVGGLGGTAGIDSMFDRYPTTAEQAWDPAKYLSNEPAVAVATPPADGTVVNAGTWGRFLMTLVLAEGISLDATVSPLTNGWAGDAYVTWRDGASSCIRIDTQSDSVSEAASLSGGLLEWASRHDGATITSVNPTTTRLTSCH